MENKVLLKIVWWVKMLCILTVVGLSVFFIHGMFTADGFGAVGYLFMLCMCVGVLTTSGMILPCILNFVIYKKMKTEYVKKVYFRYSVTYLFIVLVSAFLLVLIYTGNFDEGIGQGFAIPLAFLLVIASSIVFIGDIIRTRRLGSSVKQHRKGFSTKKYLPF